MPEPLLSIRDLVVEFSTEDGVVQAVDGISYDLYPGETLGIVGESGSGKSVSTMSLLGLIPQPPGKVVRGEAIFKGIDLLKISKKELRHIRGNEIALIFQDPMTSLNPVLKIGAQIDEAIRTHHPERRTTRIKERSIELLRTVGVPNPDRRYRAISARVLRRHAPARDDRDVDRQFTVGADCRRADDGARRDDSGADPPGAEEGSDETQAATILITHDLGLIAELADRVVVMYAGKIVELGDVHTIFESPRHPYTVGLMESLPKLNADDDWLRPIPGQPPSLISRPPGCPFHPRCFLSQGRLRCREEEPPLRPIGGSAHLTACHFAEELEGHTGATGRVRGRGGLS